MNRMREDDGLGEDADAHFYIVQCCVARGLVKHLGAFRAKQNLRLTEHDKCKY